MSIVGLIQKEFGAKLIPYESIVTVGTTPVRIIENNPERAAVIIQNVGAYNVYISTKPDVSIGNGLLLFANGGGITYIYKEDGYLAIVELYAVAPAETKLYIQELVISK